MSEPTHLSGEIRLRWTRGAPMKTRAIPIRLSDEQHEKFSQAAERAGVSLAEFMRTAAENEVDRKCRRCHGTGRDPK